MKKGGGRRNQEYAKGNRREREREIMIIKEGNEREDQKGKKRRERKYEGANTEKKEGKLCLRTKGEREETRKAQTILPLN